MQRTIRTTKPQKTFSQSQKNQTSSEINDNDATKAKLHEEDGALFSRLRFLRLFYLGLGCLFRMEILEGQKYLSASNEQLSNIHKTLHLGTKAQKGKKLVGFEPFANQRLLPPTFPRYTEIKARASAIPMQLSPLGGKTFGQRMAINTHRL